MKLRVGDTVVIITGKEKGKTGKVIRVVRAARRLVVEGGNMKEKNGQARKNFGGSAGMFRSR